MLRKSDKALFNETTVTNAVCLLPLSHIVSIVYSTYHAVYSCVFNANFIQTLI